MWWLPVWQQWQFLQPQLSKHVPRQCKLLLVHQTRTLDHRAAVHICKVSNNVDIQEAPVITDCCTVSILKFKPLFFFHSIENHPSCAYDAIYVYDGYNSNNRLLGKVCGRNTTIFHSTGSYLTVRFKSDGVVRDQGFRAYYQVVCRSQWF